MKKIRFFHPGLLMAVQLVLILTWLTNLEKSDSYYYIYGMTAIGGVLSMMDNHHHPAAVSAAWRGWTGLVAAVFSLSVVLANYALFEPLRSLMTLFNLGCGLAGGFFAAWHILLCLGRRLPEAVQENVVQKRQKPARLFWLSFLSVVVIDLMYLIFAAFPGTMTSDSMLQVYQIYTGEYNNWHPYWHTQIIRLCIGLGRAVFGSYQAGVAIFSVLQIMLLALSFSYVLVTLYQRNVPGWCIGLVWAAYALLPYHIAYSVSMWKDVFFGMACLLMVTSWYRLNSRMEASAKADMLIFALAGFCFCIWRSNGLPAYLLLFVAVALFFRKNRKLLAIMAGALICGYIMTGPVLTALNVSGGNYVEALSIPLQQVARVISEGGELTPEELELIEEFADTETICQEYRPEISDPIKNLVRASDARNAIKENPMPYLKLWVNLGLRHPGEYVKAWVDQTKGYWNGGYAYWVWTEGIFWNELDIHPAAMGGPIGAVFDLYFRYFEMIPFLKPLISIGLNVWLMILCCYVNLKNKRDEWILPLPVFAILASLLISTPVYSEFRYIYSLFLTSPLILSVTCFGTHQEK